MPATMKTAIVQIGCGLRVKPTNENDTTALSVVDIARGRQACLEYQRLRYPDYEPLEFWVTGQVAWTPLAEAEKGTTVAELNAGRVKASLHETSMIAPPQAIRCIPGHTAFSECWNTIRTARELGIKKLVIVTSCFYLSLYRPLWEKATKRDNIYAKIVFVRHDPGVVSPATWKKYRSPGLRALVTVAGSCRVGHWGVMRLVDYFTKSRITKGYQSNGHSTF